MDESKHSTLPAQPLKKSDECAAEWRDFHDRFQALTEEEGNAGAAQRNRFLQAYCDYDRHPEVWAEKGKPEQGYFCLVKAPETGLWIVSDGVSENFQSRFRTLAARAGVALGCPNGTDVEDFWLHKLYLHLLETNSDHLFAASKEGGKEGGVIRRLCVASATFCSDLERKALAQMPGKLTPVVHIPRPIQKPEPKSRGWSHEHERNLRDEGWLKAQRSLSQKEAAHALVIGERQIRNLADNGKLHLSPKGRVSIDGAFFSQFHMRHSAPK